MKTYSEKKTADWCSMVVRGMLLRDPSRLQIRAHGRHLFMRVVFDATEEETSGSFCELVIKNCKNFTLTPESEVHFMDFEGEWPPYKAMKEIDRPQLVGLDGGKLND